MRRGHLRPYEAEVLLVERLRGVEIASLQRDEVGAGGGHDGGPSIRVSCLTQPKVCQNADMSQGGPGIDLETSLGYLLKQASSALRHAMEAALRPLGMTV